MVRPRPTAAQDHRLLDFRTWVGRGNIHLTGRELLGLTVIVPLLCSGCRCSALCQRDGTPVYPCAAVAHCGPEATSGVERSCPFASRSQRTLAVLLPLGLSDELQHMDRIQYGRNAGRRDWRDRAQC